LFSLLIQQHVKKVYTDHPQGKNTHHIHGALAAAAWRYQVAMDKGGYPAYTAITSVEIERRCKANTEENKLWPMILKLLDLSAEALRQPPKMRWWLPESDEDEEVDDCGDGDVNAEKAEEEDDVEEHKGTS
jgi:hypothetical protein